MKKFARQCDATGKGMNEGFVFGNGEMYFSEEIYALEYAIKIGYDNLDDAYNDDAYYYTEWDEVDEDEWYDEDGSIHLFDNEY